jgi:hypothetical protein
MATDLRSVLWPKGPRADVWAILDPARDPKSYWALVNSHLNYSCLFAGRLPDALEQVAPHLVQLDPEDEFTDYLAAQMGNCLGVFFQCDGAMKTVRHHLRKLLTVRDPRGRKLLFRYYDPRVLRVFLPTCDASELDQMYGPIKAYWTESPEPDQVIEFRRGRLGLEVSNLKIVGARAAFTSEEEDLPAAVLPAAPVVLVQKGRPNAQRLPVVLQSAGLGGQLLRSTGLLRLFRTSSLGEPIAFHDNRIDLPVANLNPDVTIYAEASAPGTETLTLELGKNGAASAALTVVAVTLETGAGEAQYSDGITTGLGERTRIVVHPPSPAAFQGNLTLRAVGGPRLLLFREAEGGEGESLADVITILAPDQPLSLWLQAESPSAKAGDAMLQLGVDGMDGIGDWCLVTAVSVEVQAGDGAAVSLLAGASAPLPISVVTQPAGMPVQWSIARKADDGDLVISASPKPLPTLTVEAGSASLSADAVGAFEVSARVGSDAEWGGPAGACEIVMVRATVESNESTVNGRFCRCAVDPLTKRFLLTSVRDQNQEPPVQLNATIRLLGGGPDGERGVGGFAAAWAHKVISDNTGARYKGGLTAGRETPAVESISPGFRSESCLLPVQATVTPEISFPPVSGDKPIEQLWSYLDCQSVLVIFSALNPDERFALLTVGWSFTGDYTCAAGRVRSPLAAAKLAAARPLIHASPVPFAVD